MGEYYFPMYETLNILSVTITVLPAAAVAVAKNALPQKKVIYFSLTTDEIRCQSKSTKSGHQRDTVAFTSAAISMPPNSNYFSTALNLRYDEPRT